MELLTEEFAGKLLRRQKEFFSKGETLSYRYRMEQLQKLKSTVLAYERELETALAADLGKSRLESYSTEIGFVLSGITHAMKHLKKWMKPVKVRSPPSAQYTYSSANVSPISLRTVSAVRGVSSEGLSTAQLPAASAAVSGSMSS